VSKLCMRRSIIWLGKPDLAVRETDSMWLQCSSSQEHINAIAPDQMLIYTSFSSVLSFHAARTVLCYYSPSS